MEKKRIVFFVGIAVFCILLLAGFAAYGASRFLAFFANNPERLMDIVPVSLIEKNLGVSGSDIGVMGKAAEHLFANGRMATVLVLFLNNTEMRPGGGFLGSYALLRWRPGMQEPEIVVVEGSERLDARAVEVLPEPPPNIISEQLGVRSWFFRDSNWFADFSLSAKQTLRAYALEGGMHASDVDMVVGITPTVLERIMAEVGDITLDGVTFSSSNVVETLQYDVEYGYEKRDIPFADRKSVMRPLAHEIVRRMVSGGLFQISSSVEMLQSLVREKHLFAYAVHKDVAAVVEAFHAEGVLRPSSGDYLLWVDANLAALKTDHSISRHLSYDYNRKTKESVATMTYTHNGKFDWRTTRYRTFARAYVPEGSRFIRAEVQKKDGGPWVAVPQNDVSVGEEKGLQWFGIFFVLEPSNIGRVRFVYTLPEVLHGGGYTLRVQKQLGIPSFLLTVRADLDTTIVFAMPSEDSSRFGDTVYEWSADIRKDQDIRIDTSYAQ